MLPPAKRRLKQKNDADPFTAPNYNEQPIDFQALASVNGEFRDCLASNNGRLDFKNPEHLRCLTKAILLRDFRHQVHLPVDRLCPPVPIRWLYVQWIEDLIDSSRPDSLETNESIVGLDIGVGASCIYPLLICASKRNWNVYGTEIDAKNHQHALHNVTQNSLDTRIKLLQTKPDGPLIPLDTLDHKRLDFTMCNPPFFATKEEALATFSKDQAPFAACTGADVEMITPGGEIAYVRHMIEESLVLREKVQWYTVQLGKLSSLHVLVKMLKEELECGNWVVNVLQPSGATVRWVLGWSWDTYRAPDAVGRHKSLIGSGLQMEPNEMVVSESSKDALATIQSALHGLPLSISRDEFSIIVGADSAVWSRNARRKRQRDMQNGTIDDTHLARTREDWTFSFVITIMGSIIDETRSIVVRWRKGNDRAVFESFCGMLKTKLAA